MLKSSLSVTLLSLVFQYYQSPPVMQKIFDPSTMLEKIPLLSQAAHVTDKIKTDPTNWKTIEIIFPKLKECMYTNPLMIF